jgi:hypothetical protein
VLTLSSCCLVQKCFLCSFRFIFLLVLQLDFVRKKVAQVSGRDEREVRVAACPYRICPLGAHIDHQVTLHWPLLSCSL